MTKLFNKAVLEWENTALDGSEIILLSTMKLNTQGELFIKFPNEKEFKKCCQLAIDEENALRRIVFK